jgi:hypothetical protein
MSRRQTVTVESPYLALVRCQPATWAPSAGSARRECSLVIFSSGSETAFLRLRASLSATSAGPSAMATGLPKTPFESRAETKGPANVSAAPPGPAASSAFCNFSVAIAGFRVDRLRRAEAGFDRRKRGHGSLPVDMRHDHGRKANQHHSALRLCDAQPPPPGNAYGAHLRPYGPPNTPGPLLCSCESPGFRHGADWRMYRTR